MDSSPNTSPISNGTTTPLAYDDDLLATSDDELSLSEEPMSSPTDDMRDLSIEDAETAPRSDEHGPKETISRLLKGKEKEWTAVAAKKGPLQLLDLPMDVLKEIIHQLPHTNDLTSLALCHSALHSLTIPYIYSRFDIVWPDASTHTEPRSGVDALTYGLATLVMGEQVFGQGAQQKRAGKERSLTGNHSSDSPSIEKQTLTYPLPQQRRGNYYGRYTKKFSLGNGPADWVQEYLITKEGGKMLGTLVALAVARMKSLETFVWDMPTGVLRDVWLALSSLADRDDPDSCRLERVWIRWHDNSQTDISTPTPPPPLPLSAMPPPPPPAPHTSGINASSAPVAVSAHAVLSYRAVDRVEHPTFSVLPALKSLSVLDIDELPYLDEMCVLIARSRKKLRELRVGIAAQVVAPPNPKDWTKVYDGGDGVSQVDYNSTWNAADARIGDQRLGGILGILVGRIYNMRRFIEKDKAKAEDSKKTAPTPTKTNTIVSEESIDGADEVARETMDGSAPSESPRTVGESSGLSPIEPSTRRRSSLDQLSQEELEGVPSNSKEETKPVDVTNEALDKYGPHLNDKLQLETLELERVPIWVPILLKAFDWSVLTTITLLHCENHEVLWKSLRRDFSPKSYSYGSAKSYGSSSRSPPLEYRLNLKKIHTNAVSPALISFLKETLAPNSLEVLFLQEGRSYPSAVTVESIYRGPLRRHRGSLKKLMIDSSEKGPDGHITSNMRWRRWMANREILTFITSGRMSSLRELALTIDYRDWHFFLQRLPLIPHLRSLYIPNIADHAHGNNIDPKELALQIVDIVHLRPEVEICYMGISSKCFEILENKPSNYDFRNDPHSSTIDGSGATGLPGYVAVDPMTSDDEGEETEEEEDDDLDGANDETESEASEEGRDDSDGDDSYMHDDDRRGPKLRLREILFYDDKVAIFKARHGRL